MCLCDWDSSEAKVLPVDWISLYICYLKGGRNRFDNSVDVKDKATDIPLDLPGIWMKCAHFKRKITCWDERRCSSNCLNTLWLTKVEANSRLTVSHSKPFTGALRGAFLWMTALPEIVTSVQGVAGHDSQIRWIQGLIAIQCESIFWCIFYF